MTNDIAKLIDKKLSINKPLLFSDREKSSPEQININFKNHNEGSKVFYVD